MSDIRVAQRYAKSIMDLATEQNKLDRIVEDMKTLQGAAKNRDFVLMLNSPIVNTDKKLAILSALFASNCDPLTLAFFKICATKGRESALPEIATAFLEEYKNLKGILSVKITSATTLTDDVLSSLRSKILATSKNVKEVDFQTAVNPALIGGYVIEMGDTLLDTSVAHSLNELKKSFA
jgi:F-type H+-transporting ATPase subunit delta